MFESLKRILLPAKPSTGGDADAAMRFYEQARSLAEAGRSGEAASAYREALRRNPDFPEACANLGMLLSELGQPREAEGMLRRAATLAPAPSSMHTWRALDASFVASSRATASGSCSTGSPK